MSAFEIRCTPAARRAIDTLPVNVALAALALSMGDLADNPQRVGKALHAPLEGRHSAPQGHYRIVYSIGDEVVTILDVAHRRDAYRT